MLKAFLFAILFYVFCLSICNARQSEKILLRNVETLTLFSDQKTTGRRSSPVPQVKCVGGSAGCRSFVPHVVQCYNKGFDGSDVQWSCNADMPNKFKFGKIQVSCEGYDFADDDYILKGSCGLEYNLELMGSNISKGSSGFNFSNLILIAIVGLILYLFYLTCVRNYGSYNRVNDGYTNPSMFGDQSRTDAPPPPGFMPGHTPGFKSPSSDSYGYTRSSGYAPPGQSSGLGGFWSGAATGGALGYLFGSRNNNNEYSRPYSRSSSSMFSSTPTSSSADDDTYHTSTGFGGTTRR